MNVFVRAMILLSLICYVLAFHYIKPLFADHTNLADNKSTHLEVDFSYKYASSSTPSVKAQDFTLAEQGTLFLQRDNESDALISPNVNTEVDMTITGLVARVKVSQHFVNPTEHWVNGKYVFPLPEKAAVDHLVMHVGDRDIIGKIKPKQQAKRAFENAKAQGKKASLIAQHRPNLFINSLANIAPNEAITISIEYQQAIKFDNGVFSVRFPNRITPRYLPARQLQQETVSIANNGWVTDKQPSIRASSTDESTIRPAKHLAMSISLNAGFALKQLKSDSHNIISEVNGQEYSIQLDGQQQANRDFVLSWQADVQHSPSAAHFYEKVDDSYYGMLMLMPPDIVDPHNRLEREVIFVLDTSGSMHGESLEQAKQALRLAITQLSEHDRFNIIAFSSGAHRLWTDSRKPSKANQAAAIAYLSSLHANGGTEILSALNLALPQNETSEAIRQVIFITDGAVGNERELLSYIHQHLNNNRLFTIGIGAAPNAYFMTEAAMMGRGTYTFIGSVSQVNEKMQTLFDKLTRPVLANLKLSNHQGASFYPSQLPDLYKGEPIMVSYRSKQLVDNLVLFGQQKQKAWQQALDLSGGKQGSGLNVLWARRHIAQLERDKLKGADVTQTNARIQEIAMQHHIVSSMTSLIAIDERPARTMANNAQPLPQTGTGAWLSILLGVISAVLSLRFWKNRKDT